MADFFSIRRKKIKFQPGFIIKTAPQLRGGFVTAPQADKINFSAEFFFGRMNLR